MGNALRRFDNSITAVRVRNLKHIDSGLSPAKDRAAYLMVGPLSKAIFIARLDGNLINEAGTAYTIETLGADEITYTTGKDKQCYSATAHNGLRVSTDIMSALTGEFSICCWFKINSNGLPPNEQWRRIIWYVDNARYIGFEVDYAANITNNKLRVDERNATIKQYNDGLWHFVVTRRIGTTFSALIDNTTLLTSYIALTGNLGQAPSLSAGVPDYPLNGYIDTWCIWDYALSAAECSLIFNDLNTWRRINI